jgi:hypothetical protein
MCDSQADHGGCHVSSPAQPPSSRLRFNLASSSRPDLLRFLEQALAA